MYVDFLFFFQDCRRIGEGEVMGIVEGRRGSQTAGVWGIANMGYCGLVDKEGFKRYKGVIWIRQMTELRIYFF